MITTDSYKVFKAQAARCSITKLAENFIALCSSILTRCVGENLRKLPYVEDAEDRSGAVGHLVLQVHNKHVAQWCYLERMILFTHFVKCHFFSSCTFSRSILSALVRWHFIRWLERCSILVCNSCDSAGLFPPLAMGFFHAVTLCINLGFLLPSIELCWLIVNCRLVVCDLK